MSLLVRNPSLALAPAEDGYLAYDLEDGRLHRVNPTAALILELGDGTRDAESLCAELEVLNAHFNATSCLHWIQQSLGDRLFLLSGGESGVAVPAAPPLSAFHDEARELRDQGLVLAAFVCQWHATMAGPASAHEWSYLGELAHIVGRRDDAREAYEHALAIDRDNAEIAHILTALRDEPAPARMPNRSVEHLYARFAEFYERNMCRDLSYEAPRLLRDAVFNQIGASATLHVLDLGCGTGLAGREIRPRARRLTGVDLSREMIEHARSIGIYDELEVAEITSWLARRRGVVRSDTDRFDLVMACDSLIYFGDLAQVVVPAAGLLRAAGLIAFTVERSSAQAVQLTDSGRYAHSAAHIRDVARTAGLSVVTQTEERLRYEYGQEVIGLVSVLRKI